MHGIRLIRALTPALHDHGIPTSADEEQRLADEALLSWKRFIVEYDRAHGIDPRPAAVTRARFLAREQERRFEALFPLPEELGILASISSGSNTRTYTFELPPPGVKMPTIEYPPCEVCGRPGMMFSESGSPFRPLCAAHIPPA